MQQIEKKQRKNLIVIWPIFKRKSQNGIELVQLIRKDVTCHAFSMMGCHLRHLKKWQNALVGRLKE